MTKADYLIIAVTLQFINNRAKTICKVMGVLEGVVNHISAKFLEI